MAYEVLRLPNWLPPFRNGRRRDFWREVDVIRRQAKGQCVPPAERPRSVTVEVHGCKYDLDALDEDLLLRQLAAARLLMDYEPPFGVFKGGVVKPKGDVMVTVLSFTDLKVEAAADRASYFEVAR